LFPYIRIIEIARRVRFAKLSAGLCTPRPPRFDHCEFDFPQLAA